VTNYPVPKLAGVTERPFVGFVTVTNYSVPKSMDRLSVFYQQFHGLRVI